MKVIDNTAGLEVDTSEHPGYLLWGEGPLGFKPPILDLSVQECVDRVRTQMDAGRFQVWTEEEPSKYKPAISFSPELVCAVIRENDDRRARFNERHRDNSVMVQSDSDDDDDEEEVTRCIERNYPGLDEDNRTDFEEYLDAIIDIQKEHEAAETVRREARSLDHLAWLDDCRRLAHAFRTCVNSNQAFDAEKLRRASVSIDIALDTIGAIP